MGTDVLFEKKQFTYTWRIQNYSLLIIARNEYFRSPTFAIEEFGDTKYNLRLCSDYENNSQIDRINCYLYRENTGSDNYKLDVRIALLDVDGLPWFESKYEDMIFVKQGHYKFNRFKYDTIYKNKDLLLPRDTLTIRCEMWGCLPIEPVNNLCFACTCVDLDRRYFAWDIQNMIMSRPGEIISVCQQLALRRLAEMRMYVHVVENGRSVQIDFTIDRGKTCVFAMCDVSLKDESEAILEQTHHEKRFGFTLNIISEHWKLPPINLEDETVKKAKFLCGELIITDGMHTESIEYLYQSPERQQLQSEKDLVSLSEDFKKMYELKTLYDVVLRVGEQDFKAHQAVLCARSPVFCAMFEQDMKEKTSNIVDIADAEGDTISQFLHYMYTGSLEVMDLESVLELYFVADKYEVISLKDRCAGRIIADLSPQNVCRVLKLADLHKDVDLDRVTRAFFCGNLADIINLDEWKTFMMEEMEMASRLMHEVLVKKMGFKSLLRK